MSKTSSSKNTQETISACPLAASGAQLVYQPYQPTKLRVHATSPSLKSQTNQEADFSGIRCFVHDRFAPNV